MTAALPPAFSLDDARAAGLRKDQVYGMLDRGEIERVGRGAYVLTDGIDPALAAAAGAAAVQAASTMCLTSALVRHDLSDAIPLATDIALPRGTRAPAGFVHVAWHSFDRATFDIGRTREDAGGTTVWMYSAERTVIDCFRLMHQEGDDVAHDALRRWLVRRGSSPAALMAMAAAFPQAVPRLRHALDVLL